MTIENLLKKIKIIDTYSNYSFHVFVGIDSFSLRRCDHAGKEDKSDDYKTLKNLIAEVDRLYTLANNNLKCEWWFE